MWAFTPPSVAEGPASWENRLFIRVKLLRGISILEGPPGVYRAARFPTGDELKAAVRYWQGGYEYLVDDDTRAALLGADVGVDEGNFRTPAAAYGGGGYGLGPYGG